MLTLEWKRATGVCSLPCAPPWRGRRLLPKSTKKTEDLVAAVSQLSSQITPSSSATITGWQEITAEAASCCLWSGSLGPEIPARSQSAAPRSRGRKSRRARSLAPRSAAARKGACGSSQTPLWCKVFLVCNSSSRAGEGITAPPPAQRAASSLGARTAAFSAFGLSGPASPGRAAPRLFLVFWLLLTQPPPPTASCFSEWQFCTTPFQSVFAPTGLRLSGTKPGHKITQQCNSPQNYLPENHMIKSVKIVNALWMSLIFFNVLSFSITVKK